MIEANLKHIKDVIRTHQKHDKGHELDQWPTHIQVRALSQAMEQLLKKRSFSALVQITPFGRPDLIHRLSGRLDPGSVYFFQTCEARGLVITHNRSQPNLARAQTGKQKNPLILWRLVGTHSLTMIALVFFPHNVATWVHFSKKNPTPSFFFPCQVAKICPKKNAILDR